MNKAKLLLLLAVLLAQSAMATTFYGLRTNNAGGGYAEQDTVLITMASSPLAVEGAQPVTLAGAGVFADGLALTTDGRLFAFVNGDTDLSSPTGTGSAQLISIDPATAVATPIGSPLPATSINAAAFSMEDRLYAINVAQDLLLEVDPATGSVISSVDASGLAFTDLRQGDIAFDSDNNAYVAISDHYSAPYVGGVYALDLTTASLGATVISSLGLYSRINGLAFVDNNMGFFAEERGTDEVVAFGSLESPSLVAIVSIHETIAYLPTESHPNAGSMDLAGMPNAVMAEDDVVETTVNTPLTGIDVLGNDTQVLSGTLLETPYLDPAFVLTSMAGGVVSLNGDTIDYTPPADFVGLDFITYQVCLPSGDCEEATLTIVIGAAAALHAASDPHNVPTTGTFGLLLMSVLLGVLGARRTLRLPH